MDEWHILLLGFFPFACGVIFTCVALCRQRCQTGEQPLKVVISKPEELKAVVCTASPSPLQTPVLLCDIAIERFLFLYEGCTSPCLPPPRLCMLYGHSPPPVVKIFRAHAGPPSKAEISRGMRRNSCILMKSMTSFSGGRDSCQRWSAYITTGPACLCLTSHQGPRRVLGIAVAQRGAEERWGRWDTRRWISQRHHRAPSQRLRAPAGGDLAPSRRLQKDTQHRR